MSIENLNLFCIIAMALTCVVGIVMDPPALHLPSVPGVPTVASELAQTMYRHRVDAVAQDYSIRHIVAGEDGTNQYYRFTISRVGLGYRAYIDSTPRLSAPLDQLGAVGRDGRFYIDAGCRASASAVETAAKNWANAQRGNLRIAQ